MCHGHNFHRRDLTFAYVIVDTITIFKHNFKKNDENLITSSMVPLTSKCDFWPSPGGRWPSVCISRPEPLN